MMKVDPLEGRCHLQDNFRINQWLVEPKMYRISSQGETKSLEPKLMAVLCKLAAHVGEPVSQEDLQNHVWPDTHISDTILRRAISALRKTLGDDAKNPTFIQTIPKKGYRLIAVTTPVPSMEKEIAAKVPAIKHLVEDANRANSRTRWLVVGLPILLLFIWLYRMQREVNETLVTPPKRGQLTREQGVERAPVAPPGGGKVAFISDAYGNDQIFMRRTPIIGDDALGLIRLLTDGTGAKKAIAFSPNGRRLAYISTKDDEHAIYTIDSVGTLDFISEDVPESTFLWRAPGQIEDLIWPKDNTLLLSVRASAQSPLQLHQLDLKAETPTLGKAISRPPSHFWGDRHPRLSSSGVLAFARAVTDHVSDIFLWAGEGTHPKRLTFLDARIDGFDWFPDDNGLVVSIYEQGTFRLWHVNAENGETTRLELEDNARNPRFAGKHLIYQDYSISTAIWRSVRRGDILSNPAVYIFGSRWDSVARYAPDGKWIAFMSTRAGSTEIFMVDAAAHNLRQLTSSGGPFTAYPAWSPDSQSIVYELHSPKGSDIFMQKVSGGVSKRLTYGDGEERHPVFSADGKSVYFCSDKEDGWQIWHTTIEGATPQRLTQAGGYRALPGPKGKYIYYTKHEQPEVWAMDTKGKKPRRLFADPQMQWNNWTLHGDSIYYVKQVPGRTPTLEVFNLSSGISHTALHLQALPEPMSLSISPKGDHLTFALEDSRDADLKLIDVALLK